MSQLPTITLRHLMIKGSKYIGIQFYHSVMIHALIKTLDSPKWSQEYSMVYIANTPENVYSIFRTFKGSAWINCRYFYKNKPVFPNAHPVDLSSLKKQSTENKEACPPEYIALLETKRYSLNTARIYTSLFSEFIHYFKGMALHEINEVDIKKYMHVIVKQGKSLSHQNQVINAIKFYYEQVLDMPQRFYEIARPRQERKLPSVLSEEEVLKAISVTTNLKHKAIVVTIYSCGLRLSELLNLKITDVQSNRHLLLIRGGKGNKDRNTILSNTTIALLRKYYLATDRRSIYLKGRMVVNTAGRVCKV